jgi:hypothetical protein
VHFFSYDGVAWATESSFPFAHAVYDDTKWSTVQVNFVKLKPDMFQNVPDFCERKHI